MPSTRSKALALAFFTVAYNLVEGGVAMLGAALSGIARHLKQMRQEM